MFRPPKHIQAPNNQELGVELTELFRVTPDPAQAAVIHAAGLTRVSSSMQQEEGHSLEDQAVRIRNFIQERGWRVRQVFEDPGYSGRSNRRPGLQALIRAIKARQVQVVVIDRIDRLSRNLYSLLKLIQLFRKYNVKLISLRESIDFTTHWGRLVLYVMGALAEFYVSALSEEIRLSRFRKSEKGLLSGSFRYGYCRGNCSECNEPNGPDLCPFFGGPDVGDGRLFIPHPVESVAVRLMFEWYASGKYSDADIARRLREEIFALEDGTEIRFLTKGRPGLCDPKPFVADTVRAVLNNPIHTGFVPYYSEDEQGRKRHLPIAVFEGKHQPIVDLALFRHVQTIRRNRRHCTVSRRRPARIYPLTGILFCAERRSPLRGISSNGGKSRYYVDKQCQAVLPKELWHQKNLKADEVEAQVEDIVTAVTLPPEWQERILAYVLYDDGDDEIEREKSECRQELANLAPDSTPAGEEARALLANLPALWSALTDEELKSLYGYVFNGVYVQGDEIAEIEPHEPFYDLLAEATDF